ncbi:MAG: AraC family transcriptional regulator, partial [Bacillales bacterium]|nr:AraC family transcriptional regulator [Bacillales bacterium]
YANLSRLFKKEMGITIGKYISSMRCVEAELLLRKSHYSIQEISAYVGYLDNNYFVKVFKKETGYLPSEYRKINKE